MTQAPLLELNQRISSNSENYYRVIQSLGQGGNSHVYLVKAMSGELRGLLFALKLFTRVKDSTRLGRFKREVTFLKECSHPAIMRVYDDGQIVVSAQSQTIFPFVIADFLPRTLFDAMRGGLSMVEKLSFSLQLLSALAYLSNRSHAIVHRDIKPENIFVRGKACLLGDFGLMKVLDESPTADSLADDKQFMIESTGPRLPRFYRSPDLVEYCRGNGEVTTKSDVFQLGLVLSEMFTGENPLKPCRNILDPVELQELRTVSGSQSQAIRAHLSTMLGFDAANRPLAEGLFDPWEGIFKEVATISHSLEGRLF